MQTTKRPIRGANTLRFSLYSFLFFNLHGVQGLLLHLNDSWTMHIGMGLMARPSWTDGMECAGTMGHLSRHFAASAGWRLTRRFGWEKIS